MATKYRGKYPNRINYMGMKTKEPGQVGSVYIIKTYGGERIEINSKDMRAAGYTDLPPLNSDIAPLREFDVSRKSNPAKRGAAKTVRRSGVSDSAYVNRRSQITRKSPTKRLRKRRVTHVETGRPQGYFPNPIRGIVSHVGVINDGGFQFGMDAVTPVTFEFSTTEKKKYYRCFALPNAVVRNDDFQTFAKNSPRLVVTLNSLKSIVSAFQK